MKLKYSYLFIEEHVEIFKNKISSLLYDLDLYWIKMNCFIRRFKNEKK